MLLEPYCREPARVRWNDSDGGRPTPGPNASKGDL